MDNIYTDGTYFDRSPTWDIEHSSWKSKYLINILNKNDIHPRSICDVGCGAGEILNQLFLNYSSEISYSGFEISPQAYNLCKNKEKENIKFHLGDICKEEAYFDVVLLMDVIEHVEDLFGFLRNMKSKGKYKIFHVPLELFALNIMEGKIITRGITHPGHIHYFTKDIALEMLRVCGYEIIDWQYTPIYELFKDSKDGKFLRIPRKMVFKMNSDVGVRTFGGISLLVLTK